MTVTDWLHAFRRNEVSIVFHQFQFMGGLYQTWLKRNDTVTLASSLLCQDKKTYTMVGPTSKLTMPAKGNY